MPSNDYHRAREDASNGKDECFSAIIDGAPYFPNLVVDQGSSIEERDASIKKVMEHLVVQMATGANNTSASLSLDSSSWKVTPVTGGNTNQLLCVSEIRCEATNGEGEGDPDSLCFKFPNDSVLVRIFGSDGLIDRDEETSTFASMSTKNLSVKYYGRFGNGRVEEMLIGWATLTEDDLMGKAAPDRPLPPGDLNEAIARGLARLHATYEIPKHLLVEGGSLPEPTLWTQLYPWLEKSLTVVFQTDRDTQRANHELDPPLSSLREEIDWLKSEVIGRKGDEAKSAGIGFCHNDLLASNIMMKTTLAPSSASGKDQLLLDGLTFIDFEYGGINYYAYDIANHFNEYAGGTAAEDNSTPDYDRCPDESQRKVFLEAYADEYNAAKQSSNADENGITAEELGAMVDGFSLANHLVWGLWGVLQAASEGCEDGLDYMHYAKCRFDRYRHDKCEKFGTTATS